MDGFPAQRYETKIETFESCMIQAPNTDRQASQQIEAQLVPSQAVRVNEEENGDATSRQLRQHQSQHQSQRRNEESPVARNSANVQQNMTLTPVRLPAILDGEFFTVIRIEDTNVTVKCSQCQKLLNGNLKSTGNFLSHIKRVHPFMVDKIKRKSNQRKPAMIYIDLSMEKSPEIVRTKKGYRKCYKAEECQLGLEEAQEHSVEWSIDSPLTRRWKSEDSESADLIKLSQNSSSSSFVVEDEFDAIGRNVAAKLRNMRLDQRIIAEKLLNDILFEAQLGNLHRDSNVHV